MQSPNNHAGIKEFLIELLIPTIIGVFLIVNEATSINTLGTIRDMDEVVISVLRIGFTLILLPFILITDWLIYFAIWDFPLGSHGWQIRFFGKSLYAIIIILVLLKALDKIF